MVNPVVVICTHNRLTITTYNIYSLLKQKCKIVLVVSALEERIHYAKIFPEITVLTHPNVPLGAKWQHGVQHAYSLEANPLIILGSDDLLSLDFVSKVTAYMHDISDFIGLSKWYIHYKGKAFYCQYLANIPLGGGRCYSYDLLKKLNGKLFDTKLNRHLDDYSSVNIKKLGIFCHDLSDSVSIHAVKGDWPVLNQFNLTHKNIKVLSEHLTSDFFPDL